MGISVQIARLLVEVVTIAVAELLSRRLNLADLDVEAIEPLRPAENGQTNGKSYGAVDDTDAGDHHTGSTSFPSKPIPSGGWITYIKSFKIFFPQLWPSDDRWLQFLILICFILLLMSRVVNVLLPRQLGIVTDRLAGDGGYTASVPWSSVLIYVLLRFTSGNMGILGALRSFLWIPVGQYTYRRLSQTSFEHVHSLSLDFHLAKRTGEVLSALSKGSSINTFLEQLVFQILPVFVDLCLAIIYFYFSFDAYYALIVTIVTVSYLYATIKLTEWRTPLRRDMVTKMREQSAIKNDSISNYETVKYFNAEDYEFGRYRESMRTMQASEYKVISTLNLMNVTQGLLFTVGLLAACLLSAYRVSMGSASVGSFVTLIAYWTQLQGEY